MATASVQGKYLPPLILFPGLKQRKGDNPAPGAPKGTQVYRSPKGWMTSKCFLRFMQEMFVPYIQQHHIPLPVVLLVDGHPSHKTPEVGEYCRDHGIILYKFPAHSTHLLQPCDLAIFKSLKAAWYKAEWEYRRKNMIFVTKTTFAAAFKPAWDEMTANPSLAVNGFREAGIYPFTREYRRENLQVASVFIRPTPTYGDESDESSDEWLMVELPPSPHTHIPVEEPMSPEGNVTVSINDFLERPASPTIRRGGGKSNLTPYLVRTS